MQFIQFHLHFEVKIPEEFPEGSLSLSFLGSKVNNTFITIPQTEFNILKIAKYECNVTLIYFWAFFQTSFSLRNKEALYFCSK